MVYLLFRQILQKVMWVLLEGMSEGVKTRKWLPLMRETAFILNDYEAFFTAATSALVGFGMT